MEIAFTIFTLCLGLGLVAGLLAGLLGIGGGLIIVPTLLYLLQDKLQLALDIAMPMAIASSLFTIMFTGFSSALAHWRHNQLPRQLLVQTSVGVATGGIMGAQLALVLPGQQLQQVFAIMMILLALRTLLTTGKPEQSGQAGRGLWLSGGVTGVLSSLMGIGGGAILVPLLSWQKIELKQAIGCAAFCGTIVAIFGTASYLASGWHLQHLPWGAWGYVYLPACLGVVCTSMITAQWGAKLSQRINNRVLKRFFSALLIIIAMRMLMG